MESKSAICTTCFREFLSRNKLYQHIRSDHNEYNELLREINQIQSEILDSKISSDIIPSKQSKDHSSSQSNNLFTVNTSYENDLVKVIIKPQGLATMGDIPCLHRHDSLLLPNALHNPNITYRKAVPCHRLDKETGGLVVCSKTFVSEVRLRWAFRTKLARKRYRCIVIGKVCSDMTLEDDNDDNDNKIDKNSMYGMINSPIDGKDAISLFRIVSYTNSLVYDYLTTLDLWPITGRKHQLRRHMQAIGHPVLGDSVYIHSNKWPTSNTNMCLWALQIDIPNPIYDITTTVTDLSNSNNSNSKKRSIELVDSMDRDNNDSDDEDEGKGIGTDTDTDRDRLKKIVEINYLTQEEFHHRVDMEYNNRIISALKDLVDIEDNNIEKHMIHVKIDEPIVYEAIRQAHQIHYNQKKTVSSL